MVGWSRPSKHIRDSARAEAKAFGHTFKGPWKRTGLSAELACVHCGAYVMIPLAYARLAWEYEGFDGPAVRAFCKAS